MKATLPNKIISEFRQRFIEGNDNFFNGGDIERKLSDKFACKPATISRELRLLTENNQGEWLEKEEKQCIHSKRKTVWYRYKPSKYDWITKENYEKQT